jgi:hypothetical protein
MHIDVTEFQLEEHDQLEKQDADSDKYWEDYR